MLNAEEAELSVCFLYTEVLILSSDKMPINFPEVKPKALDHASACNTYLAMCQFCGQYRILASGNSQRSI